MNEKRLRSLMSRYKRGKVSLDHMMREIKVEPFLDLGFACVDHHRAFRQSLPEVIYCKGKTASQINRIAYEIQRANEVAATTLAALGVSSPGPKTLTALSSGLR